MFFMELIRPMGPMGSGLGLCPQSVMYVASVHVTNFGHHYLPAFADSAIPETLEPR